MSSKPVLFYNEFSSPSRKVLMALFEKKVDFERREIDLSKGEQLEHWYLHQVNTKGEVPVLKHGSEVVRESSVIVEYIDSHFGRPNLLFPKESQSGIKEMIKKVDEISVQIVTYGIIAFQAERWTKVLRYPASNANRNEFRSRITQKPSTFKLLSNHYQGTDIGNEFNKKTAKIEEMLNIMQSNKLFDEYMRKISTLLDEVEKELDRDNRLGPWLCGQTFSAADITLSALLVRLYQLGLDEYFWKQGTRPNLAVYSELAFRRPSVIKATKWNDFENEIRKIEARSDEINEEDEAALNAAKVGLGAALVLGGIYAARKFMKK